METHIDVAVFTTRTGNWNSLSDETKNKKVVVDRQKAHAVAVPGSLGVNRTKALWKLEVGGWRTDKVEGRTDAFCNVAQEPREFLKLETCFIDLLLPSSQLCLEHRRFSFFEYYNQSK
jgi:hypothetical protein